MLILFLIIKRMFEIQGFLNIFFKLGCSKFGPSPIIFSTDRDVVNLIFRGIIGWYCIDPINTLQNVTEESAKYNSIQCYNTVSRNGTWSTSIKEEKNRMFNICIECDI